MITRLTMFPSWRYPARICLPPWCHLPADPAVLDHPLFLLSLMLKSIAKPAARLGLTIPIPPLATYRLTIAARAKSHVAQWHKSRSCRRLGTRATECGKGGFRGVPKARREINTSGIGILRIASATSPPLRKRSAL